MSTMTRFSSLLQTWFTTRVLFDGQKKKLVNQIMEMVMVSPEFLTAGNALLEFVQSCQPFIVNIHTHDKATDLFDRVNERLVLAEREELFLYVFNIAISPEMQSTVEQRNLFEIYGHAFFGAVARSTVRAKRFALMLFRYHNEGVDYATPAALENRLGLAAVYIIWVAGTQIPHPEISIKLWLSTLLDAGRRSGSDDLDQIIATVTFLEQKRTKKVRKNKNLKNRIWKRVKIILEKTFNLRAILDLSFFFKHTFEKKRFF